MIHPQIGNHAVAVSILKEGLPDRLEDIGLIEVEMICITKFDDSSDTLIFGNPFIRIVIFSQLVDLFFCVSEDESILISGFFCNLNVRTVEGSHC